MLPKLDKFTALSKKKISEIVATLDDSLDVYARLSHDILASSADYQKLLDHYNEAKSRGKALEFLNENLEQIAAFVNDCGLIGYVDEKLYPSEDISGDAYIIGAEGAAIISAFIANKEKNAGGHPVQVVKNTDLITAAGSKRHGKIFVEQQQIHSALYDALKCDLEKSAEDFNKTYLIEVFGTTGGNHITVLTVRRKQGEVAPLFDLFDSSPALVRNGMEAAQNSLASGWCSQIIINATLKKLCKDIGLVFNNDNFFNNSEPMQEGGASYCAIFACESAHKFSQMSREEHEELLKRYKHQSFYGGKTEMAVTLDEEGYAKDLQLALPANLMTMSHFTEVGLKTRLEELDRVPHVMKRDRKESALDRVARYQDPDGGKNLLVVRKGLRQRIGHIFEIITSPDFLKRAIKVSDEKLEKRQEKLLPGSPYITLEDWQINFHPNIKIIAQAFNGILPRFSPIIDAKVEGENFKLKTQLGAITAEKFADLMKRNEIEIVNNKLDISKNLVGVKPEFSSFSVIEITVPQKDLEKVVKILKETGPLYRPKKHMFTPQSKLEGVTPIEARKFTQQQDRGGQITS